MSWELNSGVQIRSQTPHRESCLWLQEGQQLSLLETERRAALRQHEDELAAELQRLDDIAKEQRLRQLESMEQSYQTQLQAGSLSHKELPNLSCGSCLQCGQDLVFC